MDIIKKITEACTFAVKNNKEIMRSKWSDVGSNALEQERNGDINNPVPTLAPYQMNPILAVMYYLDKDTPKLSYNNSWWDPKKKAGYNFYGTKLGNYVFVNPKKYWNEYNKKEFAPVERYLGVDKAWICGFILGWFYTPRKNDIAKSHIEIIPKTKRENFRNGFEVAKKFRPIVSSIEVLRPKIQDRTLSFVKWSLEQGLTHDEIKNIVNEALMEQIVEA